MKRLGYKRMTRHVAAVVAVACALGVMTPRAQAQLWYNGDADQRNGYSSEQNTAVSDSRVYDDFVVPGGFDWDVSSIWSYAATSITGPISQAYWEIRSGVSVGDGGTLVAGGVTSAVTQTATGGTFSANDDPIYKFEVDSLNVTLGAGRYWLTIAPVGSGVDQIFIMTTSGDNAVGTPQGDNDKTYIDSPFWSTNYAAVANGFDGASGLTPPPVDVSLGVGGEAIEVAGSAINNPEPGTLIIGLMGLMAIGRTRMTHRKA